MALPVEGPPREAGENSFWVQTASDGAWHLVPPQRSIVDVLEDAGHLVATSCQQGICGTCRTDVLEGVPDHRDLCLSDAERRSNRFITPCCSRSLTERLVLDL